MGKRHWACLAAALLVFFADTRPGHAEVRISGSPDHLVLQVKGASLTDILSAMQHSFGLETQMRGVPTQHYTGTYRGSLRGVLGRLLNGNDYVLDMSAGTVKVVLVGANATTTFARGAPAEDAALRALAAAAAGPGSGGRMTRIRQQRAKMRLEQESARHQGASRE
ncbi:MAG TPA: hypothetical protein VGG01_25625 [Xanthobacteraceae bacterium]